MLGTLLGAVAHAQTVTGVTDSGSYGTGLSTTGLTEFAGTCDRSQLHNWAGSPFTLANPDMNTPPNGDAGLVSCGVYSYQTIAAGDAQERFAGAITGLTVGDDYEFTLAVGGTRYQDTAWGTRCPVIALEVGGVRLGASTVSDGVWETLVVPFTATATTMNFFSHADGAVGLNDYGTTTTNGCWALYSFGATAVQLAVAGPDADGDGEEDATDPAPNDPCTDSSGTNTSAYALANCADVSGVKAGGTAQGSCGAGEVEWTLTVANNGPAAAPNVLVNDYPISGITGVTSVSSTNCSALPCTIPSLANGASEVITICTN